MPLEAPGSPVALYRPTMYPQGSMRLNTTVQPLQGDEYDLDFVCELKCDPHVFSSPQQALGLLIRRLEQNDTYKAKMEPKNRCVRLNYEHQFHMDILPACRDTAAGGTCLVVPDREARCWKPSNPKGYASWFDVCAATASDASGVMAKADPIPDQEAASEKSNLKLDVQLLKRWRDIRYRSNCNLAPISIVLTTLAAGFYRGENSLAATLGNSLGCISRAVRTNSPRLIVLNPSNPKEDLSERWDSNPEAYREFVRGVTEFDAVWKELQSARGIHTVSALLEKIFGERIAKSVVEKQAHEIEAARTNNTLGVKKASGIISSSGLGVVPLHRNTFYGER